MGNFSHLITELMYVIIVPMVDVQFFSQIWLIVIHVKVCVDLYILPCIND